MEPGRPALGCLPHRQGSLADEHGKAFHHFRLIEVPGVVHGAANDTGALGRIGRGRSALQREDHAGSIWPERVWQCTDPAPQAVPPGASFRALGVDPTSRSGVVAAQDSRRLVELLDLQKPTAQRAGTACSIHNRGRGRSWGRVSSAADTLFARDRPALTVTSLNIAVSGSLLGAISGAPAGIGAGRSGACNPAGAFRNARSRFLQWPAGLEIPGLRFGFEQLRLVGQESFDPLVEVLRRDGLRFAGREFACHLGLRRRPGHGIARRDPRAMRLLEPERHCSSANRRRSAECDSGRTYGACPQPERRRGPIRRTLR